MQKEGIRLGNPYKDIIKMVNKNSTPKSMGEQFASDIDRYFQLSKEVYMPSKSVKPSGLGGCLREQFFILMGVERDPGKLEDPSMVTIQQSGNDRHSRLQFACQDAVNYNLPIIWLDPEEEVAKAQQKGINTVIKRRDGNELLCHNADYKMNFKCDGIILYKDIKMILEVKTEDHFKWSARVCADPKHEYQAISYSLLFGINNIMFLYENRNYTTRKGYHVSVTDEQRDEVKNRIFTVLDYEKRLIVPPKSKDKCTYCTYKQKCKKYGDGEHEWKE
jgi:CRISPR/Cas system-associated exonuclease Cas4 (RecB family)